MTPVSVRHLILNFITLLMIFRPTVSGTSSIKALAILHRHGDRNIIHPSYPNDPYSNIKYWPDGYSQLTIPGKQRLLKLGQFIRDRYKDYLTDNPTEVRSRSSGVNRCIQSAAMFLAGAYPPKDRWKWSADATWQPFPIMTRPRSEDGLLYPSADCPAMEAERKRVEQSSEYQNFVSANKDLFNYASKHSGTNVTNIQHAEYIFDDIHIERLNNYSLPSWVTDDVYNRLKHVSDMSFYFEFSTQKLQRLRTGLFFRDLIDFFTGKRTSDDDIPAPEDDGFWPKKLYHYSSHDTLIAGVLSSLKSFNNQAPPYAATIIFELHRINNSDSISIYYLNETYSQILHKITPPGCDNVSGLCSLDAFAQAMKPIVPENWSAECQETFLSPYNLSAIIAVSIGLCAGILVISLFGFLRVKRQYRRKSNSLDDTVYDGLVRSQDQ